jgi:hypothetical protein
MLRVVHPGKPRDFEFELLGNSWQFMADQAKRAERLGLGAFFGAYSELWQFFRFPALFFPAVSKRGITQAVRRQLSILYYTYSQSGHASIEGMSSYCIHIIHVLSFKK